MDEAVRTLRPGLVVVAGDVTARELLVKALSSESRALTSVFPGDPRSDASSKEASVSTAARTSAHTAGTGPITGVPAACSGAVATHGAPASARTAQRTSRQRRVCTRESARGPRNSMVTATPIGMLANAM
ncbi:hypothetical protein IAE22_27985 [Bacillus sp. S34]|nr:hypothetical protein [Bacillus sp. S34]